MHHCVHQSGREKASTFWAGCGAIRREVFMPAGGFDEGYRRTVALAVGKTPEQAETQVCCNLDSPGG
jgi:hypothetical protein